MSQNKALEMVCNPCTNQFEWSGLFTEIRSIDGVNFQHYDRVVEIGNDIPVEVEMERCKNDPIYFFKQTIKL